MARDLVLEEEKGDFRREAEVACNYCGREAEFKESSASLYGGQDFGPVWACLPCHAWVGVHPGTRKPLGTLADNQLRRQRREAHSYFDHLWLRRWNKALKALPQGKALRREKRNHGEHRRLAYQWLAAQLGLDPKDCHIGQFDAALCKRVVTLCKPYWREGSEDLEGAVKQHMDQHRMGSKVKRVAR